jgi:hypothetical protein
MTIYYLMVKTHNTTGLKYLCQTKKKDPHKYLGSGKYWIKHLAYYGKNIRTEIILETTDKQFLNDTGRYYSIIWKITTSMDNFGNRIWSNAIAETGGGPGRAGYHVGENNPMYGKERNDLAIVNRQEYRREQNSVASKKLWSQPLHKKNMSACRKNKWTDPKYIEKMKERTKTTKQVMINDIHYESLVMAAMKLGLDPSTVSKRCSSTHEKFANWNYI